METPKFSVRIFKDNQRTCFGNSVIALPYDSAQEEMMRIAADLEYGMIESGKSVCGKCTFGGFGKNATPIPDMYREDFPNAIMLHVQRVRVNSKRVIKLIYELFQL